MEEVIQILKVIKAKITVETDMTWVGIDSPQAMIEMIDHFISELELDNINVLGDINIEFLPTSSFQELSLADGWSGEYMSLANRFDAIYQAYLNRDKRVS